MKILYISSALLSSSQANAVHIMKMCQALTHNNHKVNLIADKRPGMQAAYTKYGIHQPFYIHHALRCPIRVIWNIDYLRKLLKIYNRLTKHDMLYGRYIFGMVAIAMRDKQTPLYFESHCLPSNPAQSLSEKYLYKRPNFKKLIVISQTLKEDYLKKYGRYLTADQIIVAHDGADILPIPDQIQKRRYTKHNGFNIGYSGKLTTGKGMDMILQIAKLCPDCTVHIAGGDDKTIKKWQKKNPTTNVIFHGYIEHANMPKFYYEMDILLAPLQQKNVIHTGYDIGRWTSPLKIFEYMAAKKPIIASDLSVLREVLSDHENALLCNPETPESWERAIKTIRSDSKMKERLSGTAYENIIQNYSWNKRAELIIQSCVNES